MSFLPPDDSLLPSVEDLRARLEKSKRDARTLKALLRLAQRDADQSPAYRPTQPPGPPLIQDFPPPGDGPPKPGEPEPPSGPDLFPEAVPVEDVPKRPRSGRRGETTMIREVTDQL